MKNEITSYEQGNIELLFCNSSHSFPLHSHESWCVGIVTAGEVLFQIHDEECLLKKGMVYIIPSNTGVRITAKKKYTYITVCFKRELREIFDSYSINPYFLQLSDVFDFQRICYDFMWNGEETKLVKDILSMIQTVSRKEMSDQQSSVSEVIKEAAEIIRKLDGNKFDLNNIAESVNLSKYHFIRQFKKEMGVTPNQYYIQNKLRIVKVELLASQPEAEIAAELNYSDQSHLCRQFKRMMGISLQEYKRNVRRK